MLGRILLLTYALAPVVVADLCEPGAPEAFKVRISVKAALGDKAAGVMIINIPGNILVGSVPKCCSPVPEKQHFTQILWGRNLERSQYTWNSAEEYLFKAVMAFTMRSYTNDETFQISNILLCNVTKRVSFWFLVTSPLNDSVPFPGAKVEAAIRHERNRINSAFLLNDKTLEFLEIPPTMASVSESRRSSWLIVFGVIVGLTSVGAMYLLVSGIRRQMKKRKTKEGEQEHEFQDRASAVKTDENGPDYENLSFF